MASTVSYLCLSHLFLFLTPLSSSARTHYTKPSQSSKVISSPKTPAQKLIQAFNLSPKHALNTGSPVLEEDSLIDAPLIFPNVLGEHANNSIQFLGHYAGYYRLPHTVDARMFYFFFESRKSNKSAQLVIWSLEVQGVAVNWLCSMKMVLFIFLITCLSFGMILVGTRNQI
ncbi:Serine carboxypeptidase-like 48 [Camellia lanceoleosa]|uniref:Serine carboxypeptidase-like 48 n=1 Tax=Camellia lanceoleosa TaxID=1840588 RepID=A0ACC0I295_9ERIC|nr:Serine carboxypeptidase-like 48 [Camellia lanceoleosa]